MEIKFTVDSEMLNKALKVVSIVNPQVTADQQRGFLFVVNKNEGKCCIYSQNEGHEARSSFPITEIEGEGSFIYPSDYIAQLGFISGPIVFTATTEGESFKVKYTFGASGVTDRITFDPRTMNLFEKSIQNAMSSQEPKSFSIKVLQLALGMAKPFVAKSNEKITNEYYKTIQIFGDDGDPELAKKANGYLLSSNGTEACYFHCDAFLGKSLEAPGQHLPLLESFIAQSSGFLRIYKTDRGTYVVNENNDVIGWPRHEDTYKKFSYYSKTEQIVVMIESKNLHYQLQFMRAGLHKNKSKIRLHFRASDGTFWFSSIDEGNTTTSLPVTARSIMENKINGEIVASVNVNHMLNIFDNIKGETVEFRIMILPADSKRVKDMFMFRTIDAFLVSNDGTIAGAVADGSADMAVPEGVHVCKVTRFAPGMD
jgi:hypothetical protein